MGSSRASPSLCLKGEFQTPFPGSNGIDSVTLMISAESPAATADYDLPRSADLFVFPPSNHENLYPGALEPAQCAPSSLQSDPAKPPSIVPHRWSESVLCILFSRFAKLWSSVRCGRLWGFGTMAHRWRWGKLSVAASVVLVWWMWSRPPRVQMKETTQLLQIIEGKDQKISQLLNQMAEINNVLPSLRKC